MGVTSRAGPIESSDELPLLVRQMQPSFDHNVWGEFHICPVTPDRRGWMRMVILTGARKLTRLGL
jgi:hypothetical protein